MLRPSIKYSILCGIFLVALFFVSLVFGSNPLLDIRHFLFDLGIFSLFIFFAGKEYKDFRNAGFLHFWQGISIGFIVFIPAVLIFSLSLYIIFEFNPVLIDGYKDGARSFLEAKKDIFLREFTEEQLAEQMATIDEVTAAQLVFNTFRRKIFAGFLITPVLSIILRKKPK